MNINFNFLGFLKLTFIFTFLLCSFQTPDITKKKTYDKEYKYEFYTTLKKIKPKKNRIYFWFKGGKIHYSEYGTNLELLNGLFVKFYLSNQLAEQGEFKNGLKKGIWKTWYENGTLSKIENFSNGLLNGEYKEYDIHGKLIFLGKYKNNKRHGYFINFTKQDTIRYKNDMIFEKKKLQKQKNKSKNQNNNSENLKKKKSFWSIFKKKSKND